MPKIIYRKEGHIAYISLNCPESLNAITRDMAKNLGEIWVDFQSDINLRVAILSGEGDSFCVGADIKEEEFGNWDIGKSIVLGDFSISSKRHKVWKPIIAAVHGYVYGGGLLLFLESDIRLAADDAVFAAPEAKINAPALFAPILAEYMPTAIACEMLFTGDSLKAHRAYELGLINRVVAGDQLMPSATVMANKICDSGPLAVWAMKRMFYQNRLEVEPKYIRFIKEIAIPVFNSEDIVEGKRAFIEKRKPHWKLR